MGAPLTPFIQQTDIAGLLSPSGNPITPSSPLPVSLSDSQTANNISSGSGVQVKLPYPEQIEVLYQILKELRTITFYLQSGLNVSDEPEVVRADVAVDFGVSNNVQ